MATTLNRKIYTGAKVVLTGLDNDGDGTPLQGGSAAGVALDAEPETVQNATYTLTIPRADVNAFGHKGVLGRPKLEAQSATVEFSWIPLSTNPILDGGANQNNWSEADLAALMADTLENVPDYVSVNVHTVGAITNALMTSVSGDATVGALPTFTASFIGAEDDRDGGTVVSPIDASGITVALTEPKDVVVEKVADAGDNGCVQSAAFTWDMPVELVLCLGDDPDDDGQALSSPPGTASITIEGLEVVADAVMLDQIRIGAYTFSLGGRAEIDSRTHNMAVGELFATYNYVVGATADGASMS